MSSALHVTSVTVALQPARDADLGPVVFVFCFGSWTLWGLVCAPQETLRISGLLRLCCSFVKATQVTDHSNPDQPEYLFTPLRLHYSENTFLRNTQVTELDVRDDSEESTILKTTILIVFPQQELST